MERKKSSFSIWVKPKILFTKVSFTALINLSNVIPKKYIIAPIAIKIILNVIMGRYWLSQPNHNFNLSEKNSEKLIPTKSPTKRAKSRKTSKTRPFLNPRYAPNIIGITIRISMKFMIENYFDKEFKKFKNGLILNFKLLSDALLALFNQRSSEW